MIGIIQNYAIFVSNSSICRFQRMVLDGEGSSEISFPGCRRMPVFVF